jgi:hypothetical protein
VANIDIEQRPRGTILPWIVGLVILLVVVGWLLWRNNRIPQVEGMRETTTLQVASLPRAGLEETPTTRGSP